MKTSPASILIFCSVLFIFTFQPGFVLPLPADTRSADAAAGTVLSGYTGSGLPPCSFDIFSNAGNYNAASRTISVSPAGQTVPVTVSYADTPCAGASDLTFSLGDHFSAMHPRPALSQKEHLTGTQIILRTSGNNRLSCDEDDFSIEINPSPASLYVSSPDANDFHYIEVMNSALLERCTADSGREIVFELMNMDAVGQGLDPFLNVNIERVLKPFNSSKDLVLSDMGPNFVFSLLKSHIRAAHYIIQVISK